MRRKTLIAIAAFPFVIVFAVVVYLRTADLDPYKKYVEQAVSDAIRRQLTIAGRFEPDVAFTTSLVAENITLANPDWSAEPAMVHVDRLEGTIRLWSLISGPIRIPELRLQGVRVALEVDSDRRASWDFEIADEEEKPEDDTSVADVLVIERLELADVALTYGAPTADPPWQAAFDRVDIRTEPDGMLDLEILGTLREDPIELSGRLGPLAHLFEGTNVVADLEGRLDDVAVSLRGSVADLATLGGPRMHVEIHGPEIADVTRKFDLPSLGNGPFRLEADTSPSPNGVDLKLDAAIGEFSVQAGGAVAALTDPTTFDIDVAAAVPDLAKALSIFEIENVPAGSFTATGGLRREGSLYEFRELDVRLGDNALKLHGVVVDPPKLVGTDLTFEVSGPDLSAFDPAAGVSFPAAPFRAEGRIIGDAEGQEIPTLDARLGDATLRLEGRLGEYPDLIGTNLELHGAGQDLSMFASLAGVDLPAEAFGIDGRISRTDPGFVLEGLDVRLGNLTAAIGGSVGEPPGLLGTDIRVDASGSDPAVLLDFAGLSEFPARPYDLEGRLRVTPDGYGLGDVVASYGGMTARLNGRIVAASGMVGTALKVRAAGADLSEVGTLAGIADLPADSYDVEGRVTVRTDGYELEQVEAGIGDVVFRAAGHLGRVPDVDGTDLRIEVRGPDLSALSRYPEVPELPAASFALAGRAQVQSELYVLHGVTAALGSSRVGIDGTLGPFPGLNMTDLDVEIAGDDLAALAGLVTDAGLAEMPRLPSEPFSATGGVKVVEAGYELQHVEAALGLTKLRLHGTFGAPPEFLGTDVTLDAEGPDSAWIGEIAGVAIPPEPFRARGRVERLQSGARFSGVVVELGDLRAALEGTLGEPPKLIGTDLEIRAKGADLALVSRLAELPELPGEPFEIDGHFEGTPEQFSMDRMTARLGDSDVHGSLRVDLKEKPDVEGRFSSNRINLRAILPREDPEVRQDKVEVTQDETVGDEDGTDESPAKPESSADRKKLLIPDTPLELDALQTADADIRWAVKELVLLNGTAHDVDLGLQLKNGSLTLEPLTGEGELGGTIDAGLGLEPAVDGLRVRARVKGHDWRLDFMGGTEDRAQSPLTDVELDFTGHGRSLHEIMSGANGRFVLTQGAGRIKSGMLDLLGFSLLAEIFDVLNPFTKRDGYTDYECAVIAINIAGGDARIRPIAVRTDKMTIIGSGRVELESENLDFEWTAKPRRGIGLSSSAITNPYIKLGGKLSKPALEIKPLQSVAATGAAVATAGLSILGKGLWNRVTAERKVCDLALDEIRKQDEARSSQNAGNP